MVTASCPAPFCSLQCVRKESLLIKNILHVPHAFDLNERLITEKLPQLKLSQILGYVVCVRHFESHIYHPVACQRGCGINHGQSKESESSLWREMAFSASMWMFLCGS